MDNKSYLKDCLKIIDIDISNEKLKKLYDFKEIMLEWNKKINLTTITDEMEVIQKHFIDSLIPEKYIHNKSYVLDLGTGAGFPGIPLKILREDINILLMDSVNKKINYLNEVISKLQLNNIEAFHSRAEDAAQNIEYREKFDVVISRALSNMTTLSEYMLPFVKIGGKVICMKGPSIDEELEKSKKAIEVLGGKVEEIVKYSIPNTELQYNLIILSKIKNTPKVYPRKAGKPLKEPMQ